MRRQDTLVAFLNQKSVRSPMNSKLAYLVGLIGGDGCIYVSRYEHSVHIVDECLEFHETVIAPFFEECFKIRPIVSPMKTHLGRITYRTRLRSREVAEFLVGLGIPAGAKTFSVRTPKWILEGDEKILISYVRGWMDAEGCVTRLLLRRKKRDYIYPKISMQVANAAIRDEICSILDKFAIRFSKWNSGNMHGFAITGFENAKRYMKVVGFNHPNQLTAWGQTWHTMAGTVGCNPERGS